MQKFAKYLFAQCMSRSFHPITIYVGLFGVCYSVFTPGEENMDEKITNVMTAVIEMKNILSHSI
jgi:hypothetical protein